MALPSDKLIILKADIVQKEEDVALDKLVRLQRKDLPEKVIAQKLKKRMEKVFEGHWGCIIGSAFGCYVSHVEHHYLNVGLGTKQIVLFRSA